MKTGLIAFFAVAASCVFANTETVLHKDVPYGPDRMQMMDLSLPTCEKDFPTLVFFHGGGLSAGKRHFLKLDEPRIAQIAVDYRLGPDAEFPAYLKDAAKAVSWTFKNIARYGGDTNKIFVSGHSAGGWLAAMLAADPQWLATYGISPTNLAGVAPLSGQMTDHFNVKKWQGDSGEQYRPLITKIAPFFHASNPLPPVFLAVGNKDLEFPCRVEENRFFATSLRKLGHKDVELHEYSGFGHTLGADMLADLRRFILARSNLPPWRTVRHAPQELLYVKGEASRLGDKGCKLVYPRGGEQPVIAFDLGKQSVGGYLVFRVKSQIDTPVLRVSYANHPNGLSATGDFTFDTRAKYMGPDLILPVPPANANRHETYTLSHNGSYVAPLLQGQERYIRIQLDTPGSAELDSVEIVNRSVHDNMPLDGHFDCSDKRLAALWDASVNTLQLASFPNADAWTEVDGTLLPRKLAKDNGFGWLQAVKPCKDFVLRTRFAFRACPQGNGAWGIAFRNNLSVRITNDRVEVKDGGKSIAGTRLSRPIIDSLPQDLQIVAKGESVLVSLNNKLLLSTQAAAEDGRFAIFVEENAWPVIETFELEGLYKADFAKRLDDWAFARTLPFVSDGGKRDRLVWSGDLFWAQRTAYCVFKNYPYMEGALRLLAKNQTPEGYVQACPYAEETNPPKAGDWGPFQSDEFAAWFIPVLHEHWFHTGDTALVAELFPNVRRLLAYLREHTSKSFIFVQRAETSKHACDLNIGTGTADRESRAYMNILLWKCYADAAELADTLGKTSEAATFRDIAEKTRAAVFANFWNEERGHFARSLEHPEFGFEANALALAFRFVDQSQAKRIEPQLVRVNHGKFQALAARGKCEYDFVQEGLNAIAAHNWLKIVEPDFKGAVATTECMSIRTGGWGDESHPDTAIADIFSRSILGIVPHEPGFSKFAVKPFPVKGVTSAKGSVPTPHGLITAEWKQEQGGVSLDLVVPYGTLADVSLPGEGQVRLRRLPEKKLHEGGSRSLTPGRWLITNIPSAK